MNIFLEASMTENIFDIDFSKVKFPSLCRTLCRIFIFIRFAQISSQFRKWSMRLFFEFGIGSLISNLVCINLYTISKTARAIYFWTCLKVIPANILPTNIFDRKHFRHLVFKCEISTTLKDLISIRFA